MKHIGLFEGIGGFSLAARWMGWDTIAWCEINPFCQQVLSYHFPKANKHYDIKSTDFSIYRGQCDIITGGFPCQPYSQAGKRKGKEDERHLWPEMLRTIKEVQPGWVVGENVFGLVNWSGGLVFHEVQADLEAAGYEVWPYVLPACAKDAPHRRDRIWFVAYKSVKGLESREQSRRESTSTENGTRLDYRTSNDGFNGYAPNSQNIRQRSGTVDRVGHERQGYESEQGRNNEIRGEPFGYSGYASNPGNTGLQRSKINGGIAGSGPERNEQFTGFLPPTWEEFPTQSPLCNGNDGFPARLDGITFPKWRSESIKAGGNAVVPQVPFEIFKAIEAYINLSG